MRGFAGAALLLAIVGAAPVAAQVIVRTDSAGAGLVPALHRDRPHRSGLWGELSWGPGATRSGCAGCTEVEFTGGNASLTRIGGAISDKVLLGVEMFGLLNDRFSFAGQDTAIVGEDNTIAAVLLWYPWRGGVFMQSTIGAAHVRIGVRPSGGAEVITSGTGVGLGFGVGFDKPISRKFAITLNAATHITAVGDVTINGNLIDDLIITTYQVSLGLTFR
jgi:hypothetical protein